MVRHNGDYPLVALERRRKPIEETTLERIERLAIRHGKHGGITGKTRNRRKHLLRHHTREIAQVPRAEILRYVPERGLRGEGDDLGGLACAQEIARNDHVRRIALELLSEPLRLPHSVPRQFHVLPATNSIHTHVIVIHLRRPVADEQEIARMILGVEFAHNGHNGHNGRQPFWPENSRAYQPPEASCFAPTTGGPCLVALVGSPAGPSERAASIC